MSISVHCESCGKTYNVRDEMAGRKGKCPNGHTIYVPAPYAAPAPSGDSELAVPAGEAAEPASGRKPSRRPARPAPEPADEGENSFDFPASREALAPARSEKRSGRKAPEPPPAEDNPFDFPASAPRAEAADADDDQDEPRPKSARKRDDRKKPAPARPEPEDEDDEPIDSRPSEDEDDEDHEEEAPRPKSARKRDDRKKPAPARAERDDSDDFDFPATAPRAEAAEDDEDDEEEAPRTKSARKREAPKKAGPVEPVGGNDFDFPASVAPLNQAEEPDEEEVEEEEEKPRARLGRQKPDRRPAKKESGTSKKSILPYIIAGVVAFLAVAGGATLYAVGRSEVGTLKEQLAQANGKAEEAEKKARSVAAALELAEANLTAQRQAAPPVPKPDAALQRKLDAAEKKIADLEQKLAAAEAAPPPAKQPATKTPAPKPPAPKPPAPKKDAAPDAKQAAGAPKGGENWKAPETVMGGNMAVLKAGTRAWIWLKEDAVIKAANGDLRVKFRWQLLEGQMLPAETYATVFIREPGSLTTSTTGVPLSGDGGEGEVVFKLKGVSGKVGLDFFLSDDNFAGGGKNLTVYSTFISTEADF